MAAPVALSSVAGALGLLDGAGQHVAVVGGGGKTTLAFALADQLPGPAIVTTTTKMGADQHRCRPVLLSPTDAEVAVAAAASPPIVVWRRVEGTKALGVTPADCDRWFRLVDHVLVEADGSRGKPCKAPAALEPVVPSTATIMVSVIGAHALGRVIADRCHRPLRVAALAGCRPSERLTPARAAAVLLHEHGARRAIPATGRFAVVVNQVDTASGVAVDELIGVLGEREPRLTVVAVRVEPGLTRAP